MRHLISSIAALQAKKQEGPATPDAKAIADIEKVGGAVRNLAQNDNRIEVSFQLQGSSMTDKEVALLSRLNNVAQLNLAKTSVTDASMAEVGRHTGLTILHLEQTKVTDAGLAKLKGLAQLEYLNLYGTAVTDAGLSHLASLSKLKNLYLWQTKATPEGAKKLKSSLPGVDINLGWDNAPSPASSASPASSGPKTDGAK